MRHRHGLRKLNRTSSHRKALWTNLSLALFEYGTIKTTLPKAKALRRVVEPIITLCKVDTLANRRQAYRFLKDHAVVKKVFTEVAPKLIDRPGGYLRILKNGFRVGDNAPMAVIQLLDQDQKATAKIQAS